MKNTATALLVLISLFGAAGCRGQTAIPTPAPKNIVLITIDALRADGPSYAGERAGTTPNLDAFAGEAAVFEQAISSFPGTTGSMPSLMSGLYPNFEDVEVWNRTTHYGFNDFEAPGSEDETTLTDNLRMIAEILSEHGFRTVGFNTNPNLGSANNFDQGFDEYESFWTYLKKIREHRSHRFEGAYPPARPVFDRVVERMSSPEDQPFFLFIHLMEPHSPYLPPPEFARVFDREFSDQTDLKINEGAYHQLYKQRGKLGRASKYLSYPRMGLDRDAFREHLLGLYEGEMAYCDREIQRLLSLLRENSLLDETLVVITADHGEEFFDHGFLMHHFHSAIAEELIRIPLIIRPPGGINGGARIENLVRMVDLAPTILDYLGLDDESSHMDGRSLRPLIEGLPLPPATTFISTIDYGIVRTEKWKYRLEKRGGPSGEPVERLFDIATDPLESEDLAASSTEILTDLGSQWRAFATALSARRTSIENDSGNAKPSGELGREEREQLEALGYIDD